MVMHFCLPFNEKTQPEYDRLVRMGYHPILKDIAPLGEHHFTAIIEDRRAKVLEMLAKEGPAETWRVAQWLSLKKNSLASQTCSKMKSDGLITQVGKLWQLPQRLEDDKNESRARTFSA